MLETPSDTPFQASNAAPAAEIPLVPEQFWPGHDDIEGHPCDQFVDYARMSEHDTMDALRFRLAALGNEGDNAIDIIGELRSNFVQNVSPEERHLIVTRRHTGTLCLSYIGFGDIHDESYALVEQKLLYPTFADLDDESGRGYFMMSVLSSTRGINRLTNQAGEHIGVELWFDVLRD
jgi:hypothetical protein